MKGFSLLETLIGMLLASALLVLLSNSNFNLLQSRNIKYESIQMEQSANIILNYLHRKLAQAGANLAPATLNILNGENEVDANKSDSLSYGYQGMLDCAGTGKNTLKIDFEKIILNGDQLRCDGNGGSKPSPQPMLDNVTSLQFLYGVDTNDDGSVNQYLSANNVSDWKSVKAIQAGILLRSGKPIFTENKNKTHKILDHTFTSNDRYLYRKFSLSVSLRNRLAKIIKKP